MSERDTGECWIYKLHAKFSDTGTDRPLYIGISDTPSTRMGNHCSQKWWWWMVEDIEWSRRCSRAQAEVDESFFIKNELPLFNIAESDVDPWDRMVRVASLLWTSWRDGNVYKQFVCPVCSSNGQRNEMQLSGFDVFLRNADDQIVIHADVSCDEHCQQISWGVQVRVKALLVGFGKCPIDEADEIISSARCSPKAVWEDRMKRSGTLFERLHHSAGSLIAIDGHRLQETSHGR